MPGLSRRQAFPEFGPLRPIGHHRDCPHILIHSAVGPCGGLCGNVKRRRLEEPVRSGPVVGRMVTPVWEVNAMMLAVGIPVVTKAVSVCLSLRRWTAPANPRISIRRHGGRSRRQQRFRSRERPRRLSSLEGLKGCESRMSLWSRFVRVLGTGKRWLVDFSRAASP